MEVYNSAQECIICNSRLSKVSSINHTLHLSQKEFDYCCKNLYPVIESTETLVYSSTQNSSTLLCQNCLDSSIELTNLGKQLDDLQNCFKKFIFTFSLDILHRRQISSNEKLNATISLVKHDQPASANTKIDVRNLTTELTSDFTTPKKWSKAGTDKNAGTENTNAYVEVGISIENALDPEEINLYEPQNFAVDPVNIIDDNDNKDDATNNDSPAVSARNAIDEDEPMISVTPEVAKKITALAECFVKLERLPIPTTNVTATVLSMPATPSNKSVSVEHSKIDLHTKKSPFVLKSSKMTKQLNTNDSMDISVSDPVISVPAKLEDFTTSVNIPDSNRNDTQCFSPPSYPFEKLPLQSVNIESATGNTNVPVENPIIMTDAAKSFKNNVNTTSNNMQILKLKQRDVEVKFNCHLCSRSYRSKQGFMLHRHRVHKIPFKNKTFKCEFCSYESIMKNQLNSHQLRTHTEVRPFSCRECGLTFSSEFDVELHHKKKHFTIEFSKDCVLPNMNQTILKKLCCTFCDFMTISQKCLDAHFLRKHKDSELPFKCVECNDAFLTVISLQTHYKLQHRIKDCVVGEKNNDQVENIPTQRKMLNCDLCSYSTIQKASLKTHKFLRHPQSVCTGNKPMQRKEMFSCDLCNYATILKANLESHKQKQHSGNKPYKCRKCLHTFSSAAGVKIHYERNHPLSQFSSACIVVDADVDINGDYQRILDKGYSCEFCDYKSFTKQGILTHMNNRHTGNRPFKCRECGSTFKSQGGVKTHYKRNHFLIEFSENCVVKINN